jgi:prepilin-type processing-associated H-X9-DG protein
LRQWSIACFAYNQENKGKMEVGHAAGLWNIQLRPYIGLSKETGTPKDDFNFCPVATRPRENLDGTTGPGYGLGPRSAWGLYSSASYLEGVAGSYGMNWWVYEHGREVDEGHALNKAWGRFDVKGGSRIPLFFDSFFHGAYPEATDTPPNAETDEAYWDPDSWGMGWACVNRHNEYINTAFLDGSTRKVGLKELWTLSWHREYTDEWGDIRARMGDPIDWPDWMEGMKDYW